MSSRLPPAKAGLTREEKTAIAYSFLAVVGWAMTFTVWVMILWAGPYWLNHRHTVKIDVFTSRIWTV
jgi:hypothetical protein